MVQVRSPGDMVNYIVRDLAQAANITNAAVLYDDTFGNVEKMVINIVELQM